MKKTLNFYANYNGKFWSSYFTTIRSLGTFEEKDLKIGDLVQIQHDHLMMFRAEIVSIEKIDFNNLRKSQKTILMLDCGCNWATAAHYLENICKCKDPVLITLRKY